PFDAMVEPGGFRVKDDLAHRITPCKERCAIRSRPASAAIRDTHLSGQRGDDLVDGGAGRFHALSRVDDEIRLTSLFRIRNLPRQDRLEFFDCHTWPSENPLALNIRRRSDNDHLVDTVAATGLE